MNLQNNEISFSEGKDVLKCAKQDISMANDIKQQPIKTIINEVQFNDLLNVMQYLPINNSYQPNLFNYDFLNNTPNNNMNNNNSDSLQYNNDYCFNPFINDINMSMAMATNPFYNLVNSLTDTTSIDFNNNNTSNISTNSIIDIGSNSNILDTATNNIIHKGSNSPYQVIYSGSGFDLLQILNKVINRPSPLIKLGPVDMDCAFIVVDALKFDFPIIYSSPSFEKLTGYAPNEILGRNCRFLQAPNGHVTLGSRRRYTDNNAVHCIKSSVNNLKEYQISILNYKKDGTPFLNLISIIPVYENERIRYFVGFQADVVAKTAIPLGTKYGYEGANDTSVNTYKLQQYKQPSVNLKEHLLDTSVMNNSSDADNIDINQLLLDNSPDLIQVLSIKGIFLYVSTNSIDLIGYPNQQLIGRPISTICHPADLIPLTRELKECSINEKPFSLIYRIKDGRNNQYLWMESEGKLHADSAKGRRCIILSSRVRELYQIPKSVIENYGGLNEESVWFKLSLRGLILYVTNNSYNILGKESECLLGSSFYQFFEPNSTLFLSNALDTITNGNNHIACSLEHEFVSKKGKLQLMSYFYSNSFSNKDQLQFILCQIKVKKQGEMELPAMMFNNNAYNENDSLFPYLNCTYSSSWQYEIHQLRNANKKLEEQIEECLSKKQSFKKLKTSKNKSRICHNCHRTQSPEWRKGPDGPKTLCNSCGLKYAKSQSPYKSRSSTSTDTSSNSGHDSFHPSCSSSSNSP
ncbi:hypothetical protein K502DRAFT_325936 [Neoconidiobolus thromboides FSU 785]|nr:hypothetical protein K502DRAFT_325936 [Neoconidiobolus thromboides FSU 785]